MKLTQFEIRFAKNKKAYMHASAIASETSVLGAAIKLLGWQGGNLTQVQEAIKAMPLKPKQACMRELLLFARYSSVINAISTYLEHYASL